MKEIIVAFLFLVVYNSLFGQRYEIHPSTKEAKDLIYKADSLFFENNIEESINLYNRVHEIEGYSTDLMLNLANMYSQDNDSIASFKTLNLIVDSGFIDIQYLSKNTDFSNLVKSPKWFALINRCLDNLAALTIKEGIKYIPDWACNYNIMV